MPKNGILFNLENFIAIIFPLIPLLPKPGATIIPSNFFNLLFAFFVVILSDEIHLILTFEFKLAPA